ncbi:hypothetical protein [Mesorhizobium sp. CAU 1732]|uniref:hypothetical protein n=1 Tax=Mesorhizobium sp. CAU 1732 TaxID=3140358 RepID=UPI0032611C9D
MAHPVIFADRSSLRSLGTPPTSPDWNVGGDIEIGVTGPGALSIEGGGTVTTTVGVLGLTSASTGTAMVTGLGSTWTNSDVLIVGVQGSGTLIIEEGGAVSNTDAYIGHASGAGTATVTGAGSVWANSDSLYIGATWSRDMRNTMAFAVISYLVILFAVSPQAAADAFFEFLLGDGKKSTRWGAAVRHPLPR